MRLFYGRGLRVERTVRLRARISGRYEGVPFVKRRVGFVLGALALCCAVGIAVSVRLASAQDATAQKPGKIAVINKKTVFDNYKRRETDWKALETDKNTLQVEIDKLRETVNEGRKKLREDTTLTDGQRQELVDKVAADERAYEDRWRRAQGEIDQKSDTFFSKILGQIDTGVREVGAAGNYNVILDS
ncbi:MAG: OmpH family outer membrane protein, partial [Candidatus Hydrogenedentes bacterium]|nr:OmpH family outer membrane protein [Candidatus Hydrogenedentota bacterium]